MTKASNRLAALLHQLGVARRVRFDAVKGTTASKITQARGTGAPSHRRALVTLATVLTALAAAMATAAPALAAAPEEPETTPATLVTTTTATLNGVLNPKAEATAGWYFAYTTELACGVAPTFAPEFPPGAAEEKVEAKPEHIEVTGLQPNKQYTFCMVATNELGVNVTPSVKEEKFTTKPAPPTILSESAPAPKEKEAKLEALINPNNQKTKYTFEYSESKKETAGKLEGAIEVPGTSELPEEFNAGGTAVSVTTGAVLTPQKVYYYRVTAENAKGEKAKPGKVESFLTGPPETPVEAKVKASSTTASSVEVEGVLNPGKAGEKGSTYEFLYNEGGGCEGGVPQKKTPEPAGESQGRAKERVTASIAGLQPNATYTFCLIASNAAGEKTSAVVEPVTFSTRAAPPVITEKSESATNVTQTSATITAKVNPEGLDTHVYVEYGAGQDTAPLNIGAVVGERVVSFALNGLQPGTVYPFRVVAFNSEGNVEGEGGKSFKTLEPPSAHGETPWWHVTAVPVPTDLSPTNVNAVDEVQELKVTATGGDVLWIEPVSLEEFQHKKIKSSEIKFAVFPYNASHEAVQTALQGVYGAGNVEVSGSCKEPAPPLSECYKVTFKGALAFRPVALPPSNDLGQASFFGDPKLEGEASITETTPGRVEGEIIVTATNLGDATANGEAEPITLSDVLPAGFAAVGITGEAFEATPQHVSNLPCSLQGENGVKAPACSFAGNVAPYTSVTMHLLLDVAGAKEGERKEDLVGVSGGGARPLSVSRPIPLGESTPFGLADYELVNENEGGGADTQAGSHPFQQTTTVVLNQVRSPVSGDPVPSASVKDLHFRWPAGLIGDPEPLPQCAITRLLTNSCPADTAVGVAKVLVAKNEGQGFSGLTTTYPLVNVVPSPGEPARLAFSLGQAAVYIDPLVRSGRDYGLTINTENIIQLVGFRSAEVTVWGVPGARVHDLFRGDECLGASRTGVSCTPTRIDDPLAFLSLPTSCPVDPVTHQPESLVSTVTGDTWTHQEPAADQPLLAQAVLPAMDGCDALPFHPSIVAKPDVEESSRPSGLNVDVHVPQAETLIPEGLSVADPKTITVALPVGVAVNPSSADGLQACSAAPGALAKGQLGSPGDQIGFEGLGELPGEPGANAALFSGELPASIAAKVAVEEGELQESEKTLSPGANFCPNASKVGTATVKTPILPNPLTGAVYLAAQESNPFGSVLAMYMVVEDPVSGTLVKLAGEVTLCERVGQQVGGPGGLPCQAPGQLITTFESPVQAPFEDAEIHFFGGERAPLSTPSHCGSYTTLAALTPWSAAPGEPPVNASSTFNITEGPNHSPCPGAQLPFKPTLTGGAQNVNAGAFSPFTATMSRLSGEQNLQSLEVHLPPGLSGILSNIELCPEPQANEGKCGPNSLIGETTVSVGVGGDPYTDSGGKFYLTGPYNGTGGCKVGEPNCAPFGITFEVPAKAGPFDLANTQHNHPPCDCVLVRGKIEINPLTAAITIVSNPPGTPDAIPTSIEGIPLEIQHINAITTRSNFQFNPTNCSKMEFTGTIHSSEGGTDTIGVPFQVTNCATLKFTPTVAVSTASKSSKANGASLNFKIAYPKGAMGTQSWFEEAKFDIPKQLPARLTTLQKACLAATFETNRGACPAASIIGHATVHTPVLPVPLEGPVYFVSYGGVAFPDAVLVLNGYGVHIELHGKTFIDHKTGVTSATFRNTPDVPFESIEVSIPAGRFSEFSANLPARARGSFCGQKLVMPTLFKAQNGLEINQNTPITVTGCKSLTRAQKLAAALKACHKKHGAKRAICEKAARKAYRAPATKRKR